jgi:hypothetical protein
MGARALYAYFKENRDWELSGSKVPELAPKRLTASDQFQAYHDKLDATFYFTSKTCKAEGWYLESEKENSVRPEEVWKSRVYINGAGVNVVHDDLHDFLLVKKLQFLLKDFEHLLGEKDVS